MIKLTIKIKLDIILKILRTKYIQQDYTIDELIKDDF